MTVSSVIQSYVSQRDNSYSNYIDAKERLTASFNSVISSSVNLAQASTRSSPRADNRMNSSARSTMAGSIPLIAAHLL